MKIRKRIWNILTSVLVIVLLLSACTVGMQNGGDLGLSNGGTAQSPDGGGTPQPDGGVDTSTTKGAYTPKYAPLANRTAYTLEEDHGVLGEGVGVHPGRVVWEYDENAFHWDGKGYWCLEENYDVSAVSRMFSDGLCTLAGAQSEAQAWSAIFAEFNWRVNGTDGTVGYQKGEKIVIKCNMNGLSPRNGPTTLNNQMFTPPVLLRELLLSLVEYGVAPSDITVYDASRVIPTYMQEMCGTGALSGVKFVYNARNGNKAQDAVADISRPIAWSETFEKDASEVFYPTCVTEADYMINVSSMKPHTLAGFTASAKNHFGTVMPGLMTASGKVEFPNDYRDNPPTAAGLHPFVAAMAWNNGVNWTFPQRPLGSYTVLTDLMSNADAGGKTVLYLMDALAVSPDQGSPLTTKCKWETMGGGWTNSIFLSQDPVAIDSVAYDFVAAEDAAQKAKGGTGVIGSSCLPEGHTAQNYLHEAALAYNPPSGTYYHNGYWEMIPSLGVHEHWNNAIDRQYSRNLGADEGIELVKRTH